MPKHRGKRTLEDSVVRSPGLMARTSALYRDRGGPPTTLTYRIMEDIGITAAMYGIEA